MVSFIKQLALIVGAGVASVGAADTDTVVFVYGLGGWGPDEFLGFPYWSYQDVFQAKGFDTKVAVIGKFTSNWDRAAELYAHILGIQTDYGACHSAQMGHARFGRDYTGEALYPQWSEENKLHLVGHSMGAQTMRMLELLLREGSGCAEDTSPLYQGNNVLIDSITSYSGTWDGTTFVDLAGDVFVDFIRDLHIALAGLVDNTIIDDLYTIDLEYWGLEREEGEEFLDYWVRAQDSGIISSDNKDFSLYDLSTAGARELNNLGPVAYPETHYFAVATERTFATRDCILFIFCGDEYQAPSLFMIPFLWATSLIIGRGSEGEWQINDGLVNLPSQKCPTNDNSDRSECEEYTGGASGAAWEAGKWYYTVFDEIDHIQIILRNAIDDALDFQDSALRAYEDQAARLADISFGVAAKSSEGARDRPLFEENPQLVSMTALAQQTDAQKPNVATAAISVVAALSAMVAGVVGAVFVVKRRNMQEETKEVAPEL